MIWGYAGTKRLRTPEFYFIKPTAFPKLFLNEIDFRDLRDLVGRALDVEIHLEWSEVPAEEFVRENYPD